MTFAAFMMVAALIPQLIKNHMLGPEMEKSVSPFFPVVYPLIVLLKFPGECDLMAISSKDSSYYSIAILVVGQFFLLVCFIYWIFQYASSSTDPIIQGILYTTGGIYSIIAIGLAKWVYRITVSHGEYVPFRWWGIPMLEKISEDTKTEEVPSEEEEETNSLLSEYM